MVIMMKSNFFSSRLFWSCKENNFVFMMLCLKNAQLFLLTVTVQILIIFPSLSILGLYGEIAQA